MSPSNDEQRQGVVRLLFATLLSCIANGSKDWSEAANKAKQVVGPAVNAYVKGAEDSDQLKGTPFSQEEDDLLAALFWTTATNQQVSRKKDSLLLTYANQLKAFPKNSKPTGADLLRLFSDALDKSGAVPRLTSNQSGPAHGITQRVPETAVAAPLACATTAAATPAAHSILASVSMNAAPPASVPQPPAPAAKTRTPIACSAPAPANTSAPARPFAPLARPALAPLSNNVVPVPRHLRLPPVAPKSNAALMKRFKAGPRGNALAAAPHHLQPASKASRKRSLFDSENVCPNEWIHALGQPADTLPSTPPSKRPKVQTATASSGCECQVPAAAQVSLTYPRPGVQESHVHQKKQMPGVNMMCLGVDAHVVPDASPSAMDEDLDDFLAELCSSSPLPSAPVHCSSQCAGPAAPAAPITPCRPAQPLGFINSQVQGCSQEDTCPTPELFRAWAALLCGNEKAPATPFTPSQFFSRTPSALCC